MALLGVGFVLSWSCEREEREGDDPGDCNDGGDADCDSDSDSDVEPGTCEEPPLALGVLRNSVADIDFSGEEVTYTVEHKLDIDPIEDGCIAYAEFTVRKARLGCELSLEFGVAIGGPIILLDAHLHADSFCPGWLDSDEGDYVLVDGDPFFTFPRSVPDRTAEQSCIGDETASFDGTILLEDAGRTLEINLGDMSFVGDFLSHGNTERLCPCWPDCEARECGMDTVCGSFSCGSCGESERCNETSGACECVPDCGARECGMDPFCGTFSCGSCGESERCNETSGACWQDPSPGGAHNWEAAMRYCDTLDLGGHGPGSWHLPTISELRSLIRGCPATETGGACGVTDECLGEGCWDLDACVGCEPIAGPGTGGAYWPAGFSGPLGAYWSSSSVAGVSHLMWVVGFYWGLVGGRDGSADVGVRCVRSVP